MFRLLKFAFCLGALAAVIWLAATVKLGEETLFGHARAIGKSPESQRLVDGTKLKADEVKRDVGGKLFGVKPDAPAPTEKSARKPAPTPAPADKLAGAPPAAPPAAPPSENHSDSDRRDMKRLLGAARK